MEPFRVENGIDILGNLVESNVLSVNRTEYGNLHNQGHNLISYIHDPENLYLVKNQIQYMFSSCIREFMKSHAYSLRKYNFMNTFIGEFQCDGRFFNSHA